MQSHAFYGVSVWVVEDVSAAMVRAALITKGALERDADSDDRYWTLDYDPTPNQGPGDDSITIMCLPVRMTPMPPYELPYPVMSFGWDTGNIDAERRLAESVGLPPPQPDATMVLRP